MKQGAQLFAHLKQLLKMYTRQRDKAMMLSVIEEVQTLLKANLSTMNSSDFPPIACNTPPLS